MESPFLNVLLMSALIGIFDVRIMIIEPLHEKTLLRGYRQGPTLTGLYTHIRWLEA